MNTLSNRTKKSSIFFLTLATAAIMTGCGQTKDNVDVEPKQTVEQEVVESSIAVSEETVVEPTVESEVAEETVEEPDASNLSNEDWVKSLDLETITFLIFNDTTGERKVLEDRQEYQLLEGDELAAWGPGKWMIKNIRSDLSYEMNVKYKCCFFDFTQDTFTSNSELTLDIDDDEGNRDSVTVYLSK